MSATPIEPRPPTTNACTNCRTYEALPATGINSGGLLLAVALVVAGCAARLVAR